jgi:hypothetical protein
VIGCRKSPVEMKNCAKCTQLNADCGEPIHTQSHQYMWDNEIGHKINNPLGDATAFRRLFRAIRATWGDSVALASP